MNISHVVLLGKQRWEKQIGSNTEHKAGSFLGRTGLSQRITGVNSVFDESLLIADVEEKSTSQIHLRMKNTEHGLTQYFL